jgi:uncharacterized integral membrane protein
MEENRKDHNRRGRRRIGLYASAFALVILLVAFVALAVQNTNPVELSWVFGSSQAPLVWIIIASAVLGWLVGIMTSVLIRHSTQARR